MIANIVADKYNMAEKDYVVTVGDVGEILYKRVPPSDIECAWANIHILVINVTN